MNKSGIIFGCWDLFHLGHLRALQIAANYCSILYVGVFTDEVIKEYKGRYPIMNQDERMEFLKTLTLNKCAIKPFLVKHREKLFWDGFDYAFIRADTKKSGMIALRPTSNVIYIPYTDCISTTEIKKRILHQGCVCNCK